MVQDYEKAQSQFARAFSVFLDLYHQRISSQARGQSLVQSALSVITQFERLSSRLYRARLTLRPEDPARRRLEENMAEASHQVLSLTSDPLEAAPRDFTERYRRVWRENFSLFLFTTLALFASIFIGAYVTYLDPANVSAFVDRGTIENVLVKRRWFDDVQSNPFWIGYAIAKNNIGVSINAFLGGAIFGVGGLYFVVFNGLMFGALMAFCYRYDFHEPMGTFVLSHGILEFSIIVAAAFSGFLFGRVFFMRPYRLFGFRMQKAASEAGTVLMGGLPWLVLAAALEVFVSPWPYFSVLWRLIIGFMAAALFWGWTFWPSGKVKAHRLQP